VSTGLPLSTRTLGPVNTAITPTLRLVTHAAKILDEETGMHKFLPVLTLTTNLWLRVQSFDVSRLILTAIEGKGASRG